MTKRIFLALALVAAVAGCGGDKVVKFGAVLPLTGEFELYGQSIRKGIDLALDHLRESPEFPHEVEVTVVDSEGDPEKAQGQLAELYGGGAVAAIGAIVTKEALQMVAVADRYDRVLVSPSASSPELTGISKNFYRVFPSDSREGTTMGNFASGKLQLEDVVILSKEDPYARGIQEVFKNEFERNGGTVTDLIEFPPGADLTGLVARVQTVGPSGVYVAAYAADTSKIIKQLRDDGYEGTIMATSAFASPEMIERVGAPAEGVFLTQAVFEVESEDPKIQEFVEAYRAKYGLSPDLYSAHGYDSLMVLAEVYQLAEGVPNDFWKGIRKLSDFVGVTGTIQFDEKGDAQKFPRVYVVESGNLVDYEKEVERRRRELLERLRRLEERQRQRLDNNG